MTGAIRLGMWGLWALAALAVALDWVGVAVDGAAQMWDLVDLFPEPHSPRPWALLLVLSGYVAVIGALFAMCRHINRILVLGPALAFGTLANALAGLARALVVFWAGFILADAIGPWLMLVSVGSEAAKDHVPEVLGLELMFLFLAVALFAIARALRAAEQLAQENRQFI